MPGLRWLVNINCALRSQSQPLSPAESSEPCQQSGLYAQKCLEAVNDPNQDIGEFDSEAQKKIKGFRNKLVTSHTRNK